MNPALKDVRYSASGVCPICGDTLLGGVSLAEITALEILEELFKTHLWRRHRK